MFLFPHSYGQKTASRLARLIFIGTLIFALELLGNNSVYSQNTRPLSQIQLETESKIQEQFIEDKNLKILLSKFDYIEIIKDEVFPCDGDYCRFEIRLNSKRFFDILMGRNQKLSLQNGPRFSFLESSYDRAVDFRFAMHISGQYPAEPYQFYMEYKVASSGHVTCTQPVGLPEYQTPKGKVAIGTIILMVPKSNSCLFLHYSATRIPSKDSAHK